MREVSAKNPKVLTASRSMESAAIYTALRTLHRHVGAAMTTTLNTSAVPVTYLARSSIAKWGVAPQVFDRDRLRAHARARNATAVFVSGAPLFGPPVSPGPPVAVERPPEAPAGVAPSERSADRPGGAP